MENQKIIDEVGRADRYAQTGGRVVLISLINGTGVVAKYDERELTEENWETIKCLPPAFDLPTEGSKWV